MNLSEVVKQKAIELGFDLAGITTAEPIEPAQVKYLSNWLKSGLAGRMDYMHRNFKKRINPANLLKNAQSVICLGLNYKPPTYPEQLDTDEPAGIIANFALYQDYHDFMKDRLYKLADFLRNSVDTPCRFKCCVDSAPLAERALAARAGLGFIGKNHMLINPRLGPQILLAELITDIRLEPDGPINQTCSGCDKCISACPTGALASDGRFDANKCISYLTIEFAGEVPADLAPKVSSHLFGCDECILACPFNKDAPVRVNEEFEFHSDWKYLDLNRILQWDKQTFNIELAGSSLIRSGLERLKRNAQICLKNITL
jgi:epoxyqueuosine reductase